MAHSDQVKLFYVIKCIKTIYTRIKDNIAVVLRDGRFFFLFVSSFRCVLCAFSLSAHCIAAILQGRSRSSPDSKRRCASCITVGAAHLLYQCSALRIAPHKLEAIKIHTSHFSHARIILQLNSSYDTNRIVKFCLPLLFVCLFVGSFETLVFFHEIFNFAND